MKKRSVLFAGMTLMVLVLAGCNEKASSPEASIAVETPKETAVQAKSIDSSKAGNLKGRISFAGEAAAPKELSVKGNPECAALHANGTILSEELLVKDGGLKNAFVYIKEGLEGYTFPVPAEPVIVSNEKCVYVPHVAGAQVGQAVNFHNSDSTLHNVHAYAKTNKGFNLGLPFANMKQTKIFTQTEVAVSLKCDVHPWMLGYIAVLPHPFFAVTDEKGVFEIKDLPAGEYTVEVWHEKLGVQTQKIKIEAQGAAEANFEFKAA